MNSGGPTKNTPKNDPNKPSTMNHRWPWRLILKHAGLIGIWKGGVSPVCQREGQQRRKLSNMWRIHQNTQNQLEVAQDWTARVTNSNNVDTIYCIECYFFREKGLEDWIKEAAFNISHNISQHCINEFFISIAPTRFSLSNLVWQRSSQRISQRWP